MTDRYLAVAGNIGVGKTSLVAWLQAQYGFLPVFEPFEENPYLADFYQDMPRWSFHSQVWFLSHKYRLHCELQKRGGVLVQDRTIYEDAEIFARHLFESGQMDPKDHGTYDELYQAMKANLRPPDLVIYLRCSVGAIRRRIRTRGRAAEQDIPVAYLKALNGLYEDWAKNWDRSPVLVWDTERADYLTDLVGQIAFQRAIAAFL